MRSSAPTHAPSAAALLPSVASRSPFPACSLALEARASYRSPGLWALVLNTKQLQQPCRPEGSQVLTAGGAGSWVHGVPLFHVHFFGEPARPGPLALSTLWHPGHACCPTAELAFAAANTGGGILPATHRPAPERVTTLFKSVAGSQIHVVPPSQEAGTASGKTPNL
uniref:Uncharacterized protein n=1 Tax=Myotis myotis TaxID=51298 RepID=A0A7J7VZG1_MYOMY|nr:hypothetical protein mMyoMyo1_012388 [Myotis myotis]